MRTNLFLRCYPRLKPLPEFCRLAGANNCPEPALSSGRTALATKLTPLVLFSVPLLPESLLRIVLLIILVMVSSAGTAPGVQGSGSPAKPTPAPTPIPLTKVPLEAQSALASLQEIEADVAKDQSSADGIARNLLDVTSEIDARNADDTKLLTSSPSLDVLYRLKLAWRNFSVRLSVSEVELTRHAASMEEQLARVDQLNKTWQATLQSAKQPQTPPPVLERVQSVVDSVGRTRQATESGQEHILTLQSHLSEEEARVRRALSSIDRAENRALQNIFVRLVFNTSKT
jgi:hypothetical protein